MEIQQHDGVVVEAAGISAGLRQAQREGEVSREGEGGARGLGAAALPSPSLYRAPGGAPALGDSISKGGGGQGGWLAPKPSGAPPTPRVSNPRRRGGPRGAHQPTRGWFPAHFSHGSLRDRWPHPVDPRDPSSGPGTIPITPETFPMAKLDFLYINLHLRIIPELLVTSGISSGTPNNFRLYCILISQQP